MEQFHVNEQILYTKRGTPKSVLLDYKIYREMLEMIEDFACVQIIESRKSERTLSEEVMKRKLRNQ
jgi:hypothetical protein